MRVTNTFYGFYSELPGRNIVMSYGSGIWTTEYVDALLADALKVGKRFNGPWAYIVDPRGIDPGISQEVLDRFIEMHACLEREGCTALAFLDFNNAAMKRLSQMYQDNAAGSTLTVGYFDTEMEAFDWLRGLGF